MPDTPKNVEEDTPKTLKTVKDDIAKADKTAEEDIIIIEDSPIQTQQNVYDINVDDNELNEVANNNIQVPLTREQLGWVINNEWIGSDTIDAVLTKDLINGYTDRLLVSALVWSNDRPFRYWSPTDVGRRPGRVPTIPKHSNTFEKVIIPINQHDQHWTLAILDKSSKVCTYYDTMKGTLQSNRNSSIYQKLMVICSLIVGEGCSYNQAPASSFVLQTDGVNCGPMVCMLADRIVNNRSLFFDISEVRQWRRDVYMHYIDFLQDQSTNIQSDNNDIPENIVMTDLTINIQHTSKTSNIPLSSSPTVPKKYKPEKRKLSSKNEVEVLEKMPKNEENVTDDTEPMEVDATDSIEPMEVDASVYEESIKEEESIKIQLKEKYIDWCRRTKVQKNSKNKYKYDTLMKDAKEKLKTLERIRETMQNKRALDKDNSKLAQELLMLKQEALSPYSINAINKKKSLSQIKNRALETDAESQERLKKQAASMDKHRENETPTQKSQRLAIDQSQTAQMRSTQRLNKQADTQASRQQRLSNVQVPVKFHPRKGATLKGINPYILGKRDVKCSHCFAKHFRTEKQQPNGTFTSCCQQGKLLLKAQIDNYPKYLKDLITKQHLDKAYVDNFCDKIRFYNSSISCAHFYAKNVKLAPGVPCLKIQGKVLHKMAKTYLPSANNAPFGGQNYIIDSNEATSVRMQAAAKNGQELKEEILTFLDEWMRLNNIYAKAYQMLKDTLEKEKEIREVTGEPEKDLRLVFVGKPNAARNYDKVEAKNEVALVYTPGPNGEVPRDDIVIMKNKNGQFVNEKIHELDERLETLCYPTFYPTGEADTWHTDRKHDPQNPKSKKLTRREYAAYKLQDRDEDDDGFNPLLYGGRLLLQYLCDFWSLIEGDRLSYLSENQDKIRVASYKDVIEELNKKAAEKGRAPGTVKILPSSHYGSPRYLRELCSDAISMVDEYGKPTFMATMTVNPSDEDVINNIYSKQNPWERPDVINSVFYQKMHELIRVIEKDQVFGPVECSVVVVEFQKRGLPHCHCVFTLKEKWDSQEKVDAYIRAYLPPLSQEEADACGEEFDEKYIELVKKHLIHNPCGIHNPNAPCMVNGKCKRGFPKAFCEETILDDNGFTRPKRPDNKRSFKVKVNGEEVEVDNRWVVPHNPYLLKYFRCHLNVEAINSVTTVFYVFKYMFKGDDKAFVEMNEYIDNEVRQNLNYDEIKSYEDFRYISACEAHWRISDFWLYRLSHSVDRLNVHLENEHNIVMAENPDVDQMQKGAVKNSKLMAFFDINKARNNEIKKVEDLIASRRQAGLAVDDIIVPPKILYKDVGKYYTWNTKDAKWEKRLKTTKPKLCRMYNVSPKSTQRFYLRRLLMAVPGPTSFEELRTVENVSYDTYREACVALGLVVNDKLYEETLEEAINHGTPGQLRFLFARMLAHCDLEAPMQLFEKFEEYLIADLQKRMDNDDAKKMAIRKIVKSMLNQDKQLADYPDLEAYIKEIGLDYDDNIDVQKMLKEGEEAYKTLNPQQTIVANKFLEKLLDTTSMGNCIFVDGPGGSGKSYLFETLRKLTLGHGKKIVIIAWSGIAAALYPFGRTCHNAFKLDFPFLHDSNSNVSPSSPAGKLLEEASVIIWDEFPMAPKRSLEVIEEKLREIMGNAKAFGGKILIAGGDFRQIPPIVENGTRQEIVNTSVCCSWLWALFNKYQLTENVRAKPNEVQFKKMLLEIGEGTYGPTSNLIEIPDECKSKGDIINEIFGDVFDNYDPAVVIKRAILAAWNSDVDELNDKVLNLLDDSEEKTYYAQDVYHYGDEILQSVDEIHESYKTKTINGLPNYSLRLRKNAVVMLVRNLSVEDGLCNGTRLVITQLLKHSLICQKINIDGSLSDAILIPRITLIAKHGVVDVTRHQFPVRLAFCMTINKSQGQTFDKVGVVLNHECFSHGQLYVAFSRVRSMDGLKVLLPKDKKDTANVVFKELIELGKK